MGIHPRQSGNISLNKEKDEGKKEIELAIFDFRVLRLNVVMQP
jgi:hypothetical protein